VVNARVEPANPIYAEEIYMKKETADGKTITVVGA
jgi:hypothetical protein